jgi:hypothetical protein
MKTNVKEKREELIEKESYKRKRVDREELKEKREVDV